MGHWTAFVDESGLFEPSSEGWLPGMRLVAGVLLPLAPEQAETQCLQLLRGALQEAGLGQVTAPLHASEIAHPPSFAAWLLAADGAPEALRDQARRVDQAPEPVRASGLRLLRALRHAAARELASLGGWALGVCEHGCPRTLRGEPGPLPYRRMLLGWLDHALLEVARLQRGPAALDAVVASRWAPAPAYASPWAQRLGELADQAHVELRVREAPAREVAGLQVADLLAHALGPGSLQALAPSAAMIAERTEAGLAAQVRRLLGPGLRYVEHDALLDHRLVNRATLAFLREAAFDRVAHEAQALPPARLPDGHFPASLQACAATVPALRGLWS